MKRYYLDDMRPCPDGMILKRTIEEMMLEIMRHQCSQEPFYIDFDHDLGSEEYSGYDVAKYIIQCGAPLVSFSIHSSNPVGANNIRQLLTHYGVREERV